MECTPIAPPRGLKLFRRWKFGMHTYCPTLGDKAIQEVEVWNAHLLPHPGDLNYSGGGSLECTPIAPPWGIKQFRRRKLNYPTSYSLTQTLPHHTNQLKLGQIQQESVESGTLYQRETIQAHCPKERRVRHTVPKRDESIF